MLLISQFYIIIPLFYIKLNFLIVELIFCLIWWYHWYLWYYGWLSVSHPLQCVYDISNILGDTLDITDSTGMISNTRHSVKQTYEPQKKSHQTNCSCLLKQVPSLSILATYISWSLMFWDLPLCWSGYPRALFAPSYFFSAPSDGQVWPEQRIWNTSNLTS